MAYQLAADRVWVAMPLVAAQSTYRARWRFEAEGIGLLAVDDRGDVRTPIPARASPRLLPFLRERILARPAPMALEALSPPNAAPPDPEPGIP